MVRCRGFACFTLVFILLLNGCSARRAIKLEPNPPPELEAFRKGTVGADLLYGDWLGRYRDQIKRGVCSDMQKPSTSTSVCSSGLSLPEEDRALRNSIIDAVMAKVDIEYFHYSSGLQIGSGYFNLGSDILNIGLTTSSTLVGDAAIKSILAAAATGVTGSTASVDKRLFLQESRQAIVAAMDASRTATKLAITQKESNSVAAYSMEAALSDVQSYFASGTITAAFLSIQATAGTNKANDEKTITAKTPEKGSNLQ